MGKTGKKRALCAALAALLLLALSGCGRESGGGSGKKERGSSYARGLRLCEVVGEIADSEAYGELISAPRDENIRAYMDDIGAGRYSSPRQLYALTLPAAEEALEDLASDAEEREEIREALRDVSDELLKDLDRQMATALASRVNVGVGDTALASANLCSASDVYVDWDMEEQTVWLYVFRRGFPVLVTFTPGRDGAVTASAVPLVAEALDTSSERKLEDGIFDLTGLDVRAREMELPEEKTGSSRGTKSGDALKVGQELVERMAEKAADEAFWELSSGGFGTEVRERIAEGDYGEPRHIYEVVFPADGMAAFVEAVRDGTGAETIEEEDLEELEELLEDIPDELLERFNRSLPNTLLMSRVVGMAGTEYVVAQSVLRTGECFVDSSVKAPTVYFYLFRDGAPAAVVLTPGENGAVSATAYFLPEDSLTASSASSLKRALKDLLWVDLEVREIE